MLDKDKIEFKFWEGYIDILENQKGEKLTEEQLRKWISDPNRMLECVFCQIVGPPSFFHISAFNLKEKEFLKRHKLSQKISKVLTSILCCPRCREYKGIIPHIPGFSDLE
jgi:hypothetical protein